MEMKVELKKETSEYGKLKELRARAVTAPPGGWTVDTLLLFQMSIFSLHVDFKKADENYSPHLVDYIFLTPSGCQVKSQ